MVVLRNAFVALLLLVLLVAPSQAVTFQFDYSLDESANGGNDFFAAGSEARATLEAAGQAVGNLFEDQLDAITPSGSNQWAATFFNPSNVGENLSAVNLNVAADTLTVFVGADDLGAGTLGLGGPGGFNVGGSAAFRQTVISRGQGVTTGPTATEFGPWGGALSLSTTTNWNLNHNDDTEPGEFDLYSTIVHELGHVMGFGTSDAFDNWIASGRFHGPKSQAEFGGPIPLDSSGGHWAEGLTSEVHPDGTSQEPAFDPATTGERTELTDLDVAGLEDIGWELVGSSSGGGGEPDNGINTGGGNAGGATTGSGSPTGGGGGGPGPGPPPGPGPVNVDQCIAQIRTIVDQFEAFLNSNVPTAVSEIQSFVAADDRRGASSAFRDNRNMILGEGRRTMLDILAECARCQAALRGTGRVDEIRRLSEACITARDRAGQLQSDGIDSLDVARNPAGELPRSADLMVRRFIDFAERTARQFEISQSRTSRFTANSVRQRVQRGDVGNANKLANNAEAARDRLTNANIDRIQRLEGVTNARLQAWANSAGLISQVSAAATAAIARIDAAAAAADATIANALIP